MIRIRNPSLEFNWLPNSVRKGISTPRMYLSDASDCGGLYAKKTDHRCVHEALDVDLQDGPVILICGGQTIGSVAHEYRHHWQVESGYQLGASLFNLFDVDDYKNSIIRYFRDQWWEMDALRFQLKHAPDDVSLLWRDWLMESN